jgi:hypothetical protein
MVLVSHHRLAMDRLWTRAFETIVVPLSVVRPEFHISNLSLVCVENIAHQVNWTVLDFYMKTDD